MYVHMYVYVYTHIHTHIFTDMCKCTCVYDLHIYTCIYAL